MSDRIDLITQRLASIKTVKDLKTYIRTQQDDEVYVDVVAFFKPLLEMLGENVDVSK